MKEFLTAYSHTAMGSAPAADQMSRSEVVRIKQAIHIHFRVDSQGITMSLSPTSSALLLNNSGVVVLMLMQDSGKFDGTSMVRTAFF